MASLWKVWVIHQPGIKVAVEEEIEYDVPQASNHTQAAAPVASN